MMPKREQQRCNRATGHHIRVFGSFWRLMCKRDVTAASHYAAIACEPALVHFQGSSSSIFVLG